MIWRRALRRAVRRKPRRASEGRDAAGLLGGVRKIEEQSEHCRGRRVIAKA